MPEPLFQQVFGQDWAILPKALRDHYANRAGCRDQVTVQGQISIRQSWLMALGKPILRAFKTLVPVSEDQMATTVAFRTEPGTQHLWFDRTFHRASGQEIKFVSYLEPQGGSQVIEWTRLGLGWISDFQFDGARVHLRHVGYKFRVGRWVFPLPISWIIGRPTAWEQAVSEEAFDMEMTIDHPIFGRLYWYAGRLKIVEVDLEP